MSFNTIEVSNLGKRYVLNHQQVSRHDSLRSLLTSSVRRAARRRQDPAAAQDEFWALRGVNFHVGAGERLGFIGRNGAGKSTLLKILSRITEPTEGRMTLRGRVASLLEVGTGFHPELSGRENVFLNGAILGMSRRETQMKFDEIVAFSGVERFLDTPVKRYSSGMYVRLAFAVAAHLDSEILIVDEVLAVGDGEFQKKCLDKIERLAVSGRTILFVSHDMTAMAKFCTACLVLERGRVVYQGDPRGAIEGYAASHLPAGENLPLSAFRPKWATPLISSARLIDRTGQPRLDYAPGESIVVEMTFDAAATGPIEPEMGIVLKHPMGTVAGLNTRQADLRTRGRCWTEGTMRCTLPSPPLLPGHYQVDVWLGDGPEDVDVLEQYLMLTVREEAAEGPQPLRMGVIELHPQWDAAGAGR